MDGGARGGVACSGALQRGEESSSVSGGARSGKKKKKKENGARIECASVSQGTFFGIS